MSMAVIQRMKGMKTHQKPHPQLVVSSPVMNGRSDPDYPGRGNG